MMRTARQAAMVFRVRDNNRVGMCLYEVQDAFQSGHQFPSAIAQWRGAKRRHPGDRTPPVGAPVYFSGGQHGHIAIYIGNGKVRSTDAGGAGKMATVSIDWFQRYWGYAYLGWTSDIAGRDIEFADRIDVYFSKLKPGVDDSASVRMLRRALIRRGFMHVHRPLTVDHPGNKYTAAVERAVKAWQKKKKHPQTGVLTKKQAREFFAPNKKVRLHY